MTFIPHLLTVYHFKPPLLLNRYSQSLTHTCYFLALIACNSPPTLTFLFSRVFPTFEIKRCLTSFTCVRQNTLHNRIYYSRIKQKTSHETIDQPRFGKSFDGCSFETFFKTTWHRVLCNYHPANLGSVTKRTEISEMMYSTTTLHIDFFPTFAGPLSASKWAALFRTIVGKGHTHSPTHSPLSSVKDWTLCMQSALMLFISAVLWGNLAQINFRGKSKASLAFVCNRKWTSWKAVTWK